MNTILVTTQPAWAGMRAWRQTQRVQPFGPRTYPSGWGCSSMYNPPKSQVCTRLPASPAGTRRDTNVHHSLMCQACFGRSYCTIKPENKIQNEDSLTQSFGHRPRNQNDPFPQHSMEGIPRAVIDSSRHSTEEGQSEIIQGKILGAAYSQCIFCQSRKNYRETKLFLKKDPKAERW